MQVIASAPGKAILFGEHAVIYGKPAIAVAIDKKARVKIRERIDSKTYVEVPGLGISEYLEPENDVIHEKQINKGILDYISKSLKKVNQLSGLKKQNGMDINVDLEIPIGSGLGSSAAVTVATITALSFYNKLEFKKDEIANYAHQVELDVQGAASPIDTTLSTYGGVIYLSRNSEEITHLPLNWNPSLIIGYTDRESNTRELVESVRIKKESYPSVINPIMDSIEQITDNAREAIVCENAEILGELMNINHGLLDALGVNTPELSRMVYIARKAGAIGSKITGAGGGGSIIAYSPNKIDEVLGELQRVENAFIIKLSSLGVQQEVGRTWKRRI
jgi:mevalonate kinase